MSGGKGVGAIAAVVFGLGAWCCPGAVAATGTTITVTSTAGTLGAGPSGQCTLRDALVVADSASNPALTVPASEPGGNNAATDCTGEVSGSGSPYTIALAAGQTYTLSAVDNYWFGPDGLPPISDTVTIQGNGATIARSSAGGTPAFRFFYVSGGLSGIPAGTLTLADLELSGGLARGGSSDEGGGGAGMGGAIFTQGRVTLQRTTLDANTATGGGLDPSVPFGGGGIGAGASSTTDNGAGFGGPAPGASGGSGAPASSTSANGGGGGGFRSADGGSGANGGGAGMFGGAGGTVTPKDNGGPGGAGGDGGGAGGYQQSSPSECAGGSFGTGGAGDIGVCVPSAGGGGGGIGGGGGATTQGGGGGGFGGGGGSGAVGGNGGFGGGAGTEGGSPGFGGGGPNNTANQGGGGAGMGGAVFSLFGQVAIDDSTLAGNTASGGHIATTGDGLGGAVFNVDGGVTVTGSTIASNTASGGSPGGGGIYSLAYGNTITSGGTTSALVLLTNSIVSANTGAAGGEDDLSLNDVNGSGTNSSRGGDATGSFVGKTTTAGGATSSGAGNTLNPQLGPLQLNGGTLKTIKPNAGSPVIGTGNTCDSTDELGTIRPTLNCDVGALEVTAALAPTVSTSAATGVTATSATLNGSVDPHGNETTYSFELSTSPSFGTFTSLPSSPATAGQETAAVPESVGAPGLSPDTTYYYRLVASDNAGTSTSSPPTQFTTPPAGKPGDTGRPGITGSAKAGDTLTCSAGTWTNSPSSYAYQWNRDGTPIVGATGSKYTVVSLDEGNTLTCTVTASNALGAGAPATSAGISVPVPHIAKCPPATGRLHGTALGLLKLGDTRKQAEHADRHSSARGKAYEEFFCLTPRGERVGYASPKLLKTLPAKDRRRLAGRVIWISTSSAYYSIHGIRPGATLAAASERLKLSKVFHVGKNDWYLAPAGSATAVLKVRHGIVEEIGIGMRSLTDGTRGEQRAFLTSFE